MKKLVTLLFLTFISSFIFGQTNNSYKLNGSTVVVEKVLPFNVSVSTAVKAVRDYFVLNLNDSNKTLKLSDNDIIVVKIHTPTLATHSMGAWKTWEELTIEARFKESRMKVSVSCPEINNGSTSNTLKYYVTSAAPLNANHNVWEVNLPKKTAIETFENLISYMNSIVNELENVLNNVSKEEDW